jgi:hypothetical protein
MDCVQCDEAVDYKEGMACTSCKLLAHKECATKVLKSTLSTRSGKKIFVCKHCKSESNSQGSNTEYNDDTDIKTMILKMEKNNEQIMEKLKNLDHISNFCELLSKKYDDFLKQQELQNQSIKSLTREVNELKNNLKEKDELIVSLTNKINDVEQYQMATMLEIRNIPVKEEENVTELVNNVATLCNASMSQVVECYRAPSKRVYYTPPIVVKLATTSAREEWLRRGKGKQMTVSEVITTADEGNKQIFLNEKLTPHNKNLLWQAKSRGKEKNYKYVWCKHGKIFARKNDELGVIRILNEKDLAQKMV